MTLNLDKRHKGYSKSGSIYNFCEEHNLQTPEPQIIDNNLTLEESKKRECFWINHYKNLDYNLLNRCKGGSVGTLCVVKTSNETKDFIEKVSVIHKSRYDYSKVKYINCKTKVCIICPIHGEFQQIPSSHLLGKGCSKCKGGVRICYDEFVGKAKQVHGDRYGYSKVDYVNCCTKVCIICPEHRDFFQIPSNHLKGCGCPKCGFNTTFSSNTKYTYDICKSIVEKCKNKSEFFSMYRKHYDASCRNGWLDELSPKK